MSAYTPGPWRSDVYCVWGGPLGNVYVAGTKTSVPEETQKANARLIAAAPELLEILEAIVSLDNGYSPDLWHFEKEFERARLAINTIKERK